MNGVYAVIQNGYLDCGEYWADVALFNNLEKAQKFIDETMDNYKKRKLYPSIF